MSAFNRIVAPVKRVWGRVPLRVQGKISIALPLLAVVISACLALYGNHQRARIESAVQRHFQVASTSTEVLNLMVNAETGMRGYLLTRRDEFLQPYAFASQNLPSALARLRALAEAEPGDEVRIKKLKQLDEIQTVIERQMADLAWQQHAAAPQTSEPEIYAHLAFGKRLMDDIRARLKTTLDAEDRLLRERVSEINDIRRRDYFAVFLTLTFGLGTRLVAWYLFNTGILRRIEHLVENARSLRHDQPPPFEPSGKSDALGELEQEILLVGEQLTGHHGD